MFPMRSAKPPSITTVSAQESTQQSTQPMTISSVVSIGGQVIIRGAMPVVTVTDPTSPPPFRASAHAPKSLSSASTPLSTEPEPEQVWVQLEEMLRRREAAKRFHPSYKG
jgi:hypothetical protein